jgi:predicted O-linked N-acetylglucosamine transferase (SPINDLY family)
VKKAKASGKPAGQVSYGKAVPRLSTAPAISRVQADLLQQGATLFHEGRYAELEAFGQDWIDRFPKQAAKGWDMLGLGLLMLNRFAEAESALMTGLALEPHNLDILDRLGVVLNRMHRYAEAHIINLRGLVVAPKNVHLLNNTASNLIDGNRFDEALDVVRRSLEINPRDHVALLSKGNALAGNGLIDEAIAVFEQTAELAPDWPDVWNNLGANYNRRGFSDEAILAFQNALALNPNQAESWCNLGMIYRDQRLEQDALDCFNKAIDLKPEMVTSYLNLGSLLNGTGRQIMALDYLEHARKLNPTDPMIYMALGGCFQDLGRFDDAVLAYCTALELQPDFSGAFSNFLFALNYHPTLPAEEIFKVYQQFEEINALPRPDAWGAFTNDRDPGRRLKIGYVSPDLRVHPVQQFLEPLLAHQDRGQFEIFAYADLSAPDWMSERYQGYVDHWLIVNTLNDLELAERIREDGIDILIDLAGHTGKNRLKTFSLKPAPVQVSWMGYGATTGMRAIDYFMADGVMMPPGCEPLMAETPWRLPGAGFVYRPQQNFPMPTPLPAARNGYVTFGSLSRAIRLNDELIAVWAELLKRVPTSRLAINSRDFNAPEMQEWMCRRFEAHGIDASRLYVGFTSPAWLPMADIDIMLDCFPHNSGTTLIEGLYSGLPVVTLAHRPTVGRLGASLLASVGHPEWIAADVEAYLQIAADLAADVPRLVQIRDTLRNDVINGHAMDEVGFASNVGKAFREMWQIYCAKP